MFHEIPINHNKSPLFHLETDRRGVLRPPWFPSAPPRTGYRQKWDEMAISALDGRASQLAAAIDVGLWNPIKL